MGNGEVAYDAVCFLEEFVGAVDGEIAIGRNRRAAPRLAETREFDCEVGHGGGVGVE